MMKNVDISNQFATFETGSFNSSNVHWLTYHVSMFNQFNLIFCCGPWRKNRFSTIITDNTSILQVLRVREAGNGAVIWILWAKKATATNQGSLRRRRPTTKSETCRATSWWSPDWTLRNLHRFKFESRNLSQEMFQFMTRRFSTAAVNSSNLCYGPQN